jgi:hypothetical protein
MTTRSCNGRNFMGLVSGRRISTARSEIASVDSPVRLDLHPHMAIASTLGKRVPKDISCRTIKSAPTANCWFEADLHRTRGKLLLSRDEDNLKLAEEAFRTAIAVAKLQGACARRSRSPSFTNRPAVPPTPTPLSRPRLKGFRQPPKCPKSRKRTRCYQPKWNADFRADTDPSSTAHCRSGVRPNAKLLDRTTLGHCRPNCDVRARHPGRPLYVNCVEKPLNRPPVEKWLCRCVCLD